MTREANTVRELGALIREARIARGETQKALAQRIHVTQSMISKVEKGFPGASVGLIFQILKALRLKFEVLSAGATRRTGGAEDDGVDLDAIANTGLRRK